MWPTTDQMDCGWPKNSPTAPSFSMSCCPDSMDLSSVGNFASASIWTPVLMLTARDEIGDRVRGLDVGADDYLIKPFSLLELAARLRAISRRDDRARPTVLNVGDLKLDPSTKQVWRGDVEVRLSPKELSLLELFLRHPGAVLTRSQILDAAWDFAYDGGSNVVDQYVKYLRDKVDAPFGRHDIETVRGMGYRLRVEADQ